jgi:subtilase family serine protease
MENTFNLKSFLAEGKLLKEQLTPDVEEYLINLYDLSSSEDYEEGEEISIILSREEYGDSNAYDDAEMFDKAYNEIKQQGGSIKIEGQPDITFSLQGDDIKMDFVAEY